MELCFDWIVLCALPSASFFSSEMVRLDVAAALRRRADWSQLTWSVTRVSQGFYYSLFLFVLSGVSADPADGDFVLLLLLRPALHPSRLPEEHPCHQTAPQGPTAHH